MQGFVCHLRKGIVIEEGRSLAGIRRRISDAIVALCMLALALLIIAKLDQVGETRFSGQFLAVDGDTLSIGPQRLRLAGIDAPERDQSCGRPNGGRWPCGNAAQEELERRARAGDVECAGTQRDKYHRLLVICADGQGILNARMVRAGLAVAYGDYQGEQAAARADGIGIWSGPFELPQAWRRRQKLAEDAPVAGSLVDWWRGRLGIN